MLCPSRLLMRFLRRVNIWPAWETLTGSLNGARQRRKAFTGDSGPSSSSMDGIAWAVHAGKKYPLGDTLAVAGVAAALVLVIAGVVVANWWEGRAARREAGASGGRSIRKLPYGGGNTRLLQAGGHALTCR